MFDDLSPIYLQIAERIRGEVLAGTLGADDPVMSTNQYAEFYGINPATAAKAFHQLLDEGVLYKRRGVGMFITAGARAQLLEDRRSRFFGEVLDPVLDRAALLGISVDEVVAHVAARADSHITDQHITGSHITDQHTTGSHTTDSHTTDASPNGDTA